MPTERGRAQMARSDAVVAEVEYALTELLGPERFVALKSDLRQAGEAKVCPIVSEP